MNVTKKKYLSLILLMLMAAGFGLWIANYSATDTTSLPILADIETDFDLATSGNARARLKDYRDHIVIVFFGYTSCPEVCPTGMYNLKQVMDILGDTAEQVQVLLITVDPERDTAEQLQEYVSHFHPDFTGLTGTLEEITKVANGYLTEFKKGPPFPDGSYHVGHSTHYYVLDKQGRARALHDLAASPALIAADVRNLLVERSRRFFQ